jgi:hypothetical protein
MKVVNLVDILRELQVAEWTELGLTPPDSGTAKKLPDGRDDIYLRLWTLIHHHQWGNQVFTNDSIFRYAFTAEQDGLETDGDELILYNHCKDAIMYQYGLPVLIFDVCW